jgi:hypothetical protein
MRAQRIDGGAVPVTVLSSKETSSAAPLRGAVGKAVVATGVCAIGLFAAYLMWCAVAGPVGVWQDSNAYQSVSQHPLLSLGLLAGARPPFVPLVLKITRGFRAFLVVQTLFSVGAWTLLAVTVSRLVKPGWRALVPLLAVLGFAASWPVTQWDASVLSESISLSALALIFASSLWMASRYTWRSAAVFVAACTIYAADRDQGIWLVALVGVAIGVYALWRLILEGRARAARAGFLAIAMLVVAGLTGLGALSSHRNAENIADVYYVRIFPFPSRVAWFAAQGMPEAQLIDQAVARSPRTQGQALVFVPDMSEAQWAPLNRWFPDNAARVYIEYLVTHPGYVLTAPFSRPELAFDNADGNLADYGVPSQFLPGVPHVFFPGWVIEVLGGIVAAILIFLRRQMRSAEVRVLAALGFAGVIALLIAWHGDSQEVTRHTVEGNVEARLSVLLLLLLGILGTRLARERPPSPSAPIGHVSEDHHLGGVRDERASLVPKRRLRRRPALARPASPVVSEQPPSAGGLE